MVDAYRNSLMIGLDARSVHRHNRRGTGKNLIDLYAAVLRRQSDWDVVGYHRGDDPQPVDGVRYRSRWIDIKGDRYDLWRRWRLPAAAWHDRVDLLHCPANLTPPAWPCPVLVTIHDLLPLEQDAATARTMARSIERCVRRGATILTPSRFTADQLVHRFHADPSRIVVNHWAPDRGMHYVADPARRSAIAQRYGVTEPFILHLGAVDPRKNTHAAIEAYARLPESVRRAWPMLVIGLGDDAHRQTMEDLCLQLGVTGSVRLADFAPEADMPGLFSAAGVLFYPSRSEGFGLPILDAWVARTAVVCANATSLPEVGGEAAVYVDPTDTTDMTRGLERVLADDAMRHCLLDLGGKRVRQFTWERTADRFIEAVRMTVGLTGETHRAAA